MTRQEPSQADTEPALLEQRKKNQAAIDLLDSWMNQDAEGQREQRETWEYLKKALDEDRMSYRKVFP